MENIDPNNLNTSIKENPVAEESISTQNASPRTESVNLDQKRDELLSNSKINDEVSSYLNELGGKDDFAPVESAARLSEEKKNIKQSIVRTYKSDTEEAIKMERISSASIAIAEEKKKQRHQPITSYDDAPRSKKVLLFAVSLIFVLAGIGAFNFNYIKEKISLAPAPKKALEITALVTADSNAELNLNKLGKKDFGGSLSNIISAANMKPNSIQNIYITKSVIENDKESKKLLESKEFLLLMSSGIPDILIRSLSQKYMLGVHSWNGNQPFIILKTDSYENAFAGMLLWEKNMAGDLSSIFPRNITPLTEEATTTTEQILSYKKEFEDVLVKNKDTRALRDENGNIFLIYSLPDKDTVIITSNADTLAELFNMLIQSRTVR